MAAIYSNRWNTLGFNFTERDALSSVYKISMVRPENTIKTASPLPKTFSCYCILFRKVNLNMNFSLCNFVFIPIGLNG
jgi:hypothetical protein